MHTNIRSRKETKTDRNREKEREREREQARKKEREREHMFGANVLSDTYVLFNAAFTHALL